MSLRKSARLGASLFGTLMLLSCAGPVASERGFLNRVHKDADGREAKYKIFVPWNFGQEKSVPVILFLHGSTEIGDDGESQMRFGLEKYIRSHESYFPFLTIF